MILYQKSNSSLPYNFDVRIYDNFNYVPNIHRDFELVYVINGELNVTVSGEDQLLRSGEFLLITQNEVHSFSTSVCSHVYVAVFSEDYVRDFAKDMRTRSVKKHKLALDLDDSAFIIKNLIDRTPDRLMLTACLSFVTAKFFTECTETGKACGRRSEGILHAVLDFISEHYTENIKLSDMARALGYEEHYLSRMLNSLFHKSFTSLVNEYRIYHARERLTEDAEVNLAELAFECGFGSLRNFNRAYRAVTGRSPRSGI